MSSVSGRGTAVRSGVYQTPPIDAPLHLRQAAYIAPTPYGAAPMGGGPQVNIDKLLDGIREKVNLAMSFEAQGRLSEAVTCLDQAVALAHKAKSFRTSSTTEYGKIDSQEAQYAQYASHLRQKLANPQPVVRSRPNQPGRLEQPNRWSAPRQVHGAPAAGLPPQSAAEAAAALGNGATLTDEADATLIAEVPNVTWNDVAGIDEVKRQVIDAVQTPLKWAKLYADHGAEPFRGLLLFGPPGTGKTMLAQAAANGAGCKFFNISCSDIMSKYLGDSEQRVREIFDCAERLAPSILFIDECDALFAKRSENEMDAMRRVKVEFLTRMQGFKPSSRIMVIGATNLAEQLDEAFLRRFEKRVLVPPPPAEGRKAIFESKLRHNVHNFGDADFAEFARCSENYTGADIVTVVKDAVSSSLRRIFMAQYFKKNIDGFDVPASADEPGAYPAPTEPRETEALNVRVPMSREDVLDSIARNQPASSPETMKKFRDLEQSMKRK